MIKFILIFLISLPVFSAVRVGMNFTSPSVTQGELVEAKLQIQSPELFRIQSLKGKTIGKTVYFYDVSALIKRENTDFYEADAKIIFTKSPEGPEIQDTIDNEPILVNWGAISVAPTEGAQTLLFGTFSVPERMKGLEWIGLGIAGLILLGLIGWVLVKRLRKKRQEKARLVALKTEILGCRNYDEVVVLWKRKHLLIKEFPHIQEPFLKLEAVLNQHQFKPRQSEAEKIEVVEAYRKFSRSVEGGFNGI